MLKKLDDVYFVTSLYETKHPNVPATARYARDDLTYPGVSMAKIITATCPFCKKNVIVIEGKLGQHLGGTETCKGAGKEVEVKRKT